MVLAYNATHSVGCKRKNALIIEQLNITERLSFRVNHEILMSFVYETRRGEASFVNIIFQGKIERDH